MTRTDKAGLQHWTAVSFLLHILGLIGTVWREYVTTTQETAHINFKMTHTLYQVPYLELTCAQKHLFIFFPV